MCSAINVQRKARARAWVQVRYTGFRPCKNAKKLDILTRTQALVPIAILAKIAIGPVGCSESVAGAVSAVGCVPKFPLFGVLSFCILFSPQFVAQGRGLLFEAFFLCNLESGRALSNLHRGRPCVCWQGWFYEKFGFRG